MNRVFVDLQSGDRHTGNLVPTYGTLRDIAQGGLDLRDGATFPFYDPDELDGERDDLIGEAIVVWEPTGQRWTFKVVPGTLRRESDVLLSRADAVAEAYRTRTA